LHFAAFGHIRPEDNRAALQRKLATERKLEINSSGLGPLSSFGRRDLSRESCGTLRSEVEKLSRS
jgi:hypothetical protein